MKDKPLILDKYCGLKGNYISSIDPVGVHLGLVFVDKVDYGALRAMLTPSGVPL